MNIIPILAYHNVDRAPGGVGFRELYVSRSQFARQMVLLKMLGFRGVSMAEAVLYLTGDKSGKVAALTFDDGYCDNLTNAAPILARLGFTATCFVVSRCVGKTNQWDSKSTNVVKPTMSTDQLKQWIDYGFEVGAHSRTHPHLPECEGNALAEEIKGCKEDLEHALQHTVRHFCYPYGSWNTVIAEMVRSAGFQTACTTRRGRVRQGDDLLRLSRVKVRKYDTLALFAWKVLGGYEDRRAYDLGEYLDKTKCSPINSPIQRPE
jgi:peptidoglycan/xylan/chitin deacetylase (PgdA/CDA1 family)